MAKGKTIYTDNHRQAVILIALIIDEMAAADKFEGLREVVEIKPRLIDLYARYAAAALDGIAKYSELPKPEQTPDASVFFMSEAIAAVDGIVPVSEKHICYAKAAQTALQAYQHRPAKGRR